MTDAHAIKDAMSVITQTLRDKSGLDGDGDKLVGRALGFSEGKPPKIKVNKLQTQTEQDVQRGLQLVLKGMYALVRNPRSHERLNDERETADKIILFIDYLLDFLGASHQSFTIQDFLTLVTEPHFVQDSGYVEELVSTIPLRKRSDTLIAVYREKNWSQSDNFQLVVRSILDNLGEGAIDDFLVVVSEELQRIDKVSDATIAMKILPENLWPRIQRMPRLRIENMLMKELADAWYVPANGKTSSTPATWVSVVGKQFLRKRELQDVIIGNLDKEDFDYHSFIAKYLMLTSALPDIFDSEWAMERCVDAIASSVRSGNEFMKDSLLKYLSSGNAPQEWVNKFVENLKDLTDLENPETHLAEDGVFSPETIPFLGKFVPSPNPIGPPSTENEIPF